jgi:hypothetical protein
VNRERTWLALSGGLVIAAFTADLYNRPELFIALMVAAYAAGSGAPDNGVHVARAVSRAAPEDHIRTLVSLAFAPITMVIGGVSISIAYVTQFRAATIYRAVQKRRADAGLAFVPSRRSRRETWGSGQAESDG